MHVHAQMPSPLPPVVYITIGILPEMSLMVPTFGICEKFYKSYGLPKFLTNTLYGGQQTCLCPRLLRELISSSL